jgi:flagellar basal body-associated protein FliL
MQTKKLIILSILATLLACSMLSIAAAQETSRSPAPDVSIPPNAAPLIAPAPDENSTTSDGDQIYYALDQNVTAPGETQSPGLEEGTLIAPLTNNAATPDNTLLFVAIGVLAVVIGCGAVGAVYYRRNTSKQQI